MRAIRANLGAGKGKPYVLLGVGSFAGMRSSLASEERVIGLPTDARQFHTVDVVRLLPGGATITIY
jgi:hypothetical protein